jgi:hypothetical protein
MSTRFVTNAIFAVAAGFLVVASQAFSSSATGWIAFGIAIGILAVACLAQADASRGVVQRSLDGVVAIVSAWTIIASVVFHGATVRWLSAGEALALVALALAGLTYNEVREQKAIRAAAGTSVGESLRAAA